MDTMTSSLIKKRSCFFFFFDMQVGGSWMIKYFCIRDLEPIVDKLIILIASGYPTYKHKRNCINANMCNFLFIQYLRKYENMHNIFHLVKLFLFLNVCFAAYRNAEDMNHHSVCLHVLADSVRRSEVHMFFPDKSFSVSHHKHTRIDLKLTCCCFSVQVSSQLPSC